MAGGAAAGLIPFSGCKSELADLIANRAERPNIIFILADDLGYGDLGTLRHPISTGLPPRVYALRSTMPAARYARHPAAF